MIVGTAGHVDHGKTSLVRRLTGVDADRLPEEKRRGMTIDLGFAYTRLADGTEIGFVDVPGHERFLRNMLAGVLGIDAVLLTVAADDGPMPQTREHLAILDLIGVARLVAVVTKIDRVEPARAEQAVAEVRQSLVAHGFADSPILPVSSETGAGFAALEATLAELARHPAARAEHAGFRLPVDRCFALSGAGTVVTGTVASGRARVGDLLLLSPRGTQVRVRGIRAQDRETGEAVAGARCALAISGARLDRALVERGDWLLAPDLHAPVQRLDARVRLCDDHDLRPGLPVHLHLGTADVVARATPLREPRGADEGFVRLVLDRPVGALQGDRLILRDHAARQTLGGGHVVDPFPPTRRRGLGERLALLRALDAPRPDAALAALLDLEGSVALAGFARARNLDPATLRLPDCRRIGRAGATVLVSPARHGALRQAVLDFVAAWHASRPGEPGPVKAVLIQKLQREAPSAVLEAVIADLLTAGALVREQAALRRPDHVPRLDDEDAALWSELEPVLARAGLRAPRVRELAERFGRDPEEMERSLARLEAFGLLLRVARNRFFLLPTMDELAVVASTLAGEAEEGGFAAGEFARRTGIGRNLAIQVLEFLDRVGVTRRVGELRRVVRPLAEALG